MCSTQWKWLHQSKTAFHDGVFPLFPNPGPGVVPAAGPDIGAVAVADTAVVAAGPGIGVAVVVDTIVAEAVSGLVVAVVGMVVAEAVFGLAAAEAGPRLVVGAVGPAPLSWRVLFV